MKPLNLSGEAFCNYIGISYSRQLLKDLRELNLVGFFKVGVKYMYPTKDADKLNALLQDNKVSIKTDKGSYYITINEQLGLINSI